LILVVCCLGLLPTGLRSAEQRVEMVNGIGLIDYSRKQKLEPGSWVKYQVTGRSDAGMFDDYLVTILIAGEEKFWGEDCFWVESTTEPKDRPSRMVATLMSYGIFDDSLPLPRMQLFTRKVISDVDPNGNPIQTITKRAAGSLTGRQPPQAEPLTVLYDTLGADTVITPAGSFQCKKIAIKQGVAATTDVGDSTMRTEMREDRVVYMNDRIPITALAREDIENSIRRKSWMIGKSQEAPVRVMDHATGSARLVGMGRGMEPKIVPVPFRTSLSQRKSAAPKPPVRAKPKPRKTG
jgi:hypothetical protein